MAGAANESQSPKGKGDTVTVACKLPHGLRLRVFRAIKVSHPVMGGGMREVDEHHPIPDAEFEINGNAFPQNTGPRVSIASTFALTHGVPKDFWELWWKQNQSHPAVINGLIYAAATQQRAQDEAREKVAIKTGLERIDPNNLPKDMKRLKTADEQTNIMSI